MYLYTFCLKVGHAAPKYIKSWSDKYGNRWWMMISMGTEYIGKFFRSEEDMVL